MMNQAHLRSAQTPLIQQQSSQSQCSNPYQQQTTKLQRLPIPVHIEEFYEYGGKAVCSNHIFNFKIGK